MTGELYDQGDQVLMRHTFYTLDDGSAANPTTATFSTLAPDGTATDHVYGVDSNVIRDSTGNYHYHLTVDQAGDWHWKWRGSSAAPGVTNVEEGSFYVRQTPIG